MPLIRHEIFGAPECPLMHRWTLVNLEDRGKLMVHWFLPNREDPDCHDHPRSFLTLVLWGSYTDIRKDGWIDRVRAPTIRYRSAEHAHTTHAGPRGCLTVAVFGRRRRRWGFWRRGIWMPWAFYLERYNKEGFRCPD